MLSWGITSCVLARGASGDRLVIKKPPLLNKEGSRNICERKKPLLEPGIEDNGPDRGITDQSHVSFHVY